MSLILVNWWIRSLFTSDCVSVAVALREAVFITSRQSTIMFGIKYGPRGHWVPARFKRVRFNPIDFGRVEWSFRYLGFGYGVDGEVGSDDTELEVVSLPYWLPVMCLTFVSGLWLLGAGQKRDSEVALQRNAAHL
jgi:hypothetical protein